MSVRSRILPVFCLALLVFATVASAHDALAAYRSNTGNGTSFPKVRFWDGAGAGGNGSWGPEIELPDSGSALKHLIARHGGNANKLVIITQSTDDKLDAYVCTLNCRNASNWFVTNDIGVVESAAASARKFDGDFEESTGDFVVVYGVNSTNASRDLAYKLLPIANLTFTGITEQFIDDTGHATDIAYIWIRAARNKTNTSEGMIFTAFDNTENDINAWVWNGSSFGNQLEISTQATATGNDQALAVRFAFDGSKGMVIGGNGTTGNINWAYWNGASWSSIGTFDIDSGDMLDLRWSNLDADPSTDDLQAALFDTGSDLHAAYWNGSAWNVTSNIDTAIDSASTRVGDFAWETTGSTGRLVWDTDGTVGTNLSTVSCSPQCTGAVTNISSFAVAGDFIALVRNPHVLPSNTSNETVRILGLRLNSANNLGSFAFNSTSWFNYGDGIITNESQTGFEIESIDFQTSFITPIIYCPLINESGEYKQFTNLFGADNNASPLVNFTCVKITASNVDYDCNGFNITDNGTAGTTFGIEVNGSLTNVTIRNCPGISQYTQAIRVHESNNSAVTNVTLFNNSVGVEVSTGNNVTINGSVLRDNDLSGILLTNGSSNTLSNNTVRSNGASGANISGANNTLVASDHYYNNSLDFVIEGTGTSVNLSAVIFDNPSGNFTNYTNLSLTDVVSSSYSIDHAVDPGSVPAPGYFSFADKFIDISAISGTVSIDSATWHWLDSELGVIYDESAFELWKYNGSWFLLNATPDTFANTLSNTSLSPLSVFAILQAPPFTLLKLDQTALQPSPGGIVEFNITVNNTGNSTINVTINDTLPSGLTFLSASPANTSAGPSWNFLLGPGNSTVLYLNATVDPGVVNASAPVLNLTNCANGSETGSNLTVQSCANVTVYYANVSVLKLDQTIDQPSPGGIVQFNITVTNTGNVTLDPAEVVDELPSGLTFLSASPAPDSVVGQTINWDNVGPLAPGGSAILFINASVDAGVVSAGTPIVNLTNCANSTGVPPNGDNVSASGCANVTVYYANVTIVKLDVTPLTPVSPGGWVLWNISASNPGEVPLNVTIVDTLPPGFQFVNSSFPPINVSPDNRTITWNDLAMPGDSGSLLFNSTVAGNVTNGTYCNDANITGVPPNGDNVTDNDTACVGIFAPAINLVKSASPTSASVNGTVTYTLNITNTGSVNLTVTVVDVLPANVTFLGSSPPETSSSPPVITWENITVLSPGTSFLITYNVSANATGTFVNNATATGTPPNGNNVSDGDTATFTVTAGGGGGDGDGDGDKNMVLSYSFVCPGNKVVFNSTKTNDDPLSAVSVKVLYEDFPYNLVGTVVSGADGLSEIVLSYNGTYKAIATKPGYNNEVVFFEFTTCPPVGCQSDLECPSTMQCVDGDCEPVECQCGVVQNHSCIAYQCCADSDCPAGQQCVGNNCVPKYECDLNGPGPEDDSDDCPDDEYCDVPENATGGVCRPVEGCGLVQDHMLAEVWECGGPGCPACPQDYTCVDYQCVIYDLTGPEIAFVGDNVTLNGTENGLPCAYCEIEVTLPDGRNIRGMTDGSGGFVLPISMEGTYYAKLLKGGPESQIAVKAVLRGPPLEPERPILTAEVCISLLLLLLLLAILYILWKRRKETIAVVLTSNPALNRPVEIQTINKKSEKAEPDVPVLVMLNGKDMSSGKSNKYGKFSFTPVEKGEYAIYILGRKEAEATFRL
jgi:uncharacterized repeat protein (TIGR01451 family)